MTKSITTAITVAATPIVAFDAINNVSAWWDGITGATTAVGDEFVHVLPGMHYCGLRVTELVTGKTVEWLVTGSYLAFVADKREWTNTTIRFDISNEGDNTRIDFTHRGIAPEVECYEVCLTAWNALIQANLKRLIETGAGVAPVLVSED